jgi:hypothetical protein
MLLLAGAVLLPVESYAELAELKFDGKQYYREYAG